MLKIPKIVKVAAYFSDEIENVYISYAKAIKHLEVMDIIVTTDHLIFNSQYSVSFYC